MGRAPVLITAQLLAERLFPGTLVNIKSATMQGDTIRLDIEGYDVPDSAEPVLAEMTQKAEIVRFRKQKQ